MGIFNTIKNAVNSAVKTVTKGVSSVVKVAGKTVGTVVKGAYDVVKPFAELGIGIAKAQVAPLGLAKDFIGAILKNKTAMTLLSGSVLGGLQLLMKHAGGLRDVVLNLLRAAMQLNGLNAQTTGNLTALSAQYFAEQLFPRS